MQILKGRLFKTMEIPAIKSLRGEQAQGVHRVEGNCGWRGRVVINEVKKIIQNNGKGVG